MKDLFISIIVPTRNEEKNLPRLFQSLRQLNYPKDKLELIIVDGGSTDQTVTLAKNFGAKVLSNTRKIRGAGCKIGVAKAKGQLVAFTDADCVVPKNWLKDLLPFFNQKEVASVGGPNVTPKDDTPFAKAAGEVVTLLTRPGSRYGYQGHQVTEIYHNPGCNVLYLKKAILKVGNFNPRLLTCEDEELDFRLLQAGYRLLFTPQVVVDHYRRPTYKKIFIQAYRFAIGRVQAGKLHPQMFKWFHFLPSLGLLGLVAAVGSLFSHFRIWGIYFLAASFLVFLAASFYLALTKKNQPFYVYLKIIGCWFFGWAWGFLTGLIS